MYVSIKNMIYMNNKNYFLDCIYNYENHLFNEKVTQEKERMEKKRNQTQKGWTGEIPKKKIRKKKTVNHINCYFL